MKKKILIIFLILIICGMGSFVYLIGFTDVFKSDEQLFWKYATRDNELKDLFCNENIKKINQERQKSSYKTDSELRIEQGDNIYSFAFDTKAQNSNSITSECKITKNSEEVTKFKLIKTNNIIGLKMDELADGYITAKGGRIKEIAINLGVSDPDVVPEAINVSSIYDVMDMSKDDEDYIQKKYGSIIKSNIDKSSYKKLEKTKIKINDKFYSVDGYELSLSENEVKQILVNVFSELATDSQTLNIISTRLKMVNVPTKYSSVNSLSDRFSEIAKNINSMDTTDDEYVKIILYVNEKRVIQANIEFNDDDKIIINYSNERDSIKIVQETNDNDTANKYKFLKVISNRACNILEQIKEANMSVNVSQGQLGILLNVSVILKNNTAISYNSNTNVTDDVVLDDDYENSRKIVLNNLQQQQLKKFWELAKNNITEIYKEKMEVLTNGVE